MLVVDDEKTEEKGTFKLDPSKKPKTIDFTSNENAVMTIMAIYELDGDNLKICFGMPDGPRPTEFPGKDGDDLVILRRKN